MKAYVIIEYGKPSVFQVAQMEEPQPGPGQVLIRVAASSVNPIDGKIRSGAVPINPEFPAILGTDVSGLIDEVGEGVTDFAAGDAVYACAGGLGEFQGALAEFMVTDARLVAKKPEKLTLGDAAVLPLVTITAWEALINKADIQPGQKVLIHGGTGGVGHIALQLAKWKGAYVSVTCSSEEKMDLACSLGADAAINYKTKAVADYTAEHTGGKGFDIVFATAGGADEIQQAVEASKPNGTICTINGRITLDIGPLFAKGITLHTIMMLIPILYNINRAHHGEILRQAAELVDTGRLTPLIHEQRFGFRQIADAHTLLEAGGAIGKIALEADW